METVGFMESGNASGGGRMTKTLNDTDIIAKRRDVIKSFAARAGLVAAVVAGGVALLGTPASASDAHAQTDTDQGAHSDYREQTDHD